MKRLVVVNDDYNFLKIYILWNYTDLYKLQSFILYKWVDKISKKMHINKLKR